ncbi:Lrp/AsnC family transcriptional regulator [Pontiella sulfatireligans]|uniref:Leucine-responsive regulatory protein n=1 Tax=Pontiella sulfatireligans TaxID=2750658 RepID=A0A6C2UKD1_9BACT|nr:Lrp/AsnC family transcriptional regulator [Pontiella sulfatireligans]VGO19861.1 Leucine-responsive regulatory protein [Pontiella sulfatireligans]
MNELLNLLKQNAFESPENLAKILGITVDEVKKQIAAYERDGVIRAYQAVVNEEKLDSSLFTTVIEVKITPESEGGFDRIADRISRFPEVESVFLMSGGFDLLVFIKGRTMQEAFRFVSETLAIMPGVISTATHFMMKAYKQNGIIMHTGEGDERLKVSP